MNSLSRIIAVILLFTTVSTPFGLVTPTSAQTPASSTGADDRARRAWPSDQSSIVKRASDGASTVTLSKEPVMRIALAVDTRGATISTNAGLLNVSDFGPEAQRLDSTRVRIESRTLTPARTPAPRSYEIEIGRSLSREDADQLVQSVHQASGETAQVRSDSNERWSVIVVKDSRTETEDSKSNLEELGFDVLSVREIQTPETTASAAAPVKTKDSNPNSRIKLTSRAVSATRELVAFAHGAAPTFHSSAPLTFASSDERNAPVRFNDKPYRGRIEVFANLHGALTVVNVIGLEDYVRGVVPNELSYPALEAMKAQAIAARTYAVKNRGQFAAEGFDLLPTTRSQVYRGLTSETSLASQAVDQTRGVIATYKGEPINALYTSTCGGRTEDVENIFNERMPYLRGRECAAEDKAAFAPFTLKSSRELFEIKDEHDLGFARDVALLAVHGINLPTDKISSSWLSAPVSESEARDWLSAVARLAHNPGYQRTAGSTTTPAFASGLIKAIFMESRADALLNKADADYLLSFRDGEDVPAANRADVAMLLRDGALSLFADATLRPTENISRARALHAIARLLESRNLLVVQKGTSRPAAGGVMVLRSAKGKDTPFAVSPDAFLFREFGEQLYQMKSLVMVGGEPIAFHLNAKGEVDYLEMRPANNGAAADRYSSLSNWTAELSLGAVQSRLGRSMRGIGAITDLQISKRGTSRRVIDLGVIGTQGVAHIRGGRIRSALGLKEQLFVIDRVRNENNRVTAFVFTGRGWGHGVGMCQFGAYGLAKQGLNVEQILKTYYTGIELTRVY